MHVNRSGAMTGWLSWLFAISYLALGSLVPFLALNLRERGVDGIVLTAALGALPLSRLVFGPLSSVLADRYQAPTRMVRIGAALAAVGAVMLWLVPADWWVVFAMLVLAIGRAPAGPVLDGLTLQSLADRAEYGRVRRWGSLGFMVGAVGVGWLVDYTPFGPIEVVAVVSIVFWVLSLLMPSSDAVERIEILPALRTLMKDRFVRWMIPAAALHFAPHVANTSFIAVHIDGLGHGAVWTGWAIAGGVTFEILLMGWSRSVISRVGADRLLLLSMFLAIPRWVLMMVVSDPVGIVLVNTIHGITFGMFWIASVALMNARAPVHVATSAQGLLALAVGGLGSSLGVIGASWIVTTWDTQMMYQVSIVTGMMACVCGLKAVRS
jgi:MFS transporter, PPP family, 3-phenylpropionic acid transporter